ncbi:MAG TPA: outer membrane beta-barrel protein [Parafilimonas sp.]|nr:outer membrane beta-barrel protein [Parafilimonas sp.]
MQRMFFVIVLFFSASISFAQKTVIRGRIYDSIIQKGLAYTTVSLVHAGDSTLVSFARADSSGFFDLNAVEKGKYLLSASYVGYVPVWKTIEVNGASIQNIGDVYMQDVKFASDVTVNVKRPPVVINNDTLEFNTENFKTQPNAVVEDMLKKMPGVTVDKDGTVKINGQTIKRVLVNGREFFTGDVKMATQNLPADAVDKVQVFDRQSDQSQFTGADDGNSEKTINLKLKKDKDNALFGKLMAGAGSDERYDAQANMNRFKGKEQLSLLGMSNNTNRQGFELMDVLNFTGELQRGMRNGGGIEIRTETNNNNDNRGLPVTGLGQQQQGIANTTAGGINYNNIWNKDKTDWSSNYMGSDIHLNTDQESNTQNILPGNSYNSFKKSNSIYDNTQHRLNVILDQKIDSSLSFRITPSAVWQSTDKKSAEQYSSETTDAIKLNQGFTNTTSEADAFNFNMDMLLRKRFAKKGRTVSLNMSMLYNHSESTGTLLSDNIFYNNDGSTSDTSLNQTNTRDAITRNFVSTLIYTEPVGKRSLLEVKSFFNTNTGNSNKQTYDYNDISNKYDAYNPLLSNDYKNNYTYAGGGISFRTNQKKLNITAGSQLQFATLKGKDIANDQNIKQRFTDVLPTAIVQYNISRMKNLRLEYNTFTTQPSIVQLQPVADVSDPLNIVIGNPSLKRQYQHNIQINLLAANPAARKNLFGLLNFTTTANAIVRVDSVKQNGTRVSSYTNANGVYAVFGNLEYGFPLKKLKSRVDVGSSARYGRNVSFVNTERNDIATISIGPNVEYHFGIDNKIDLDVAARLWLNNTKYSLQSYSDNNYLRQDYSIGLTNYLPWNISIRNDFNYIIYTGRADGFNSNIPLWNASIAKGILKNRRGEFKFSVQDILNKNTGITRSSNQGYITDEKYNVLRRYFLLGFTYSLNKSGLNTGGPRAVLKTFGP